MDNYINTQNSIEKIVDELSSNLAVTANCLMTVMDAQDSYNSEEDPLEKLKKDLELSKSILNYEAAFNEGHQLLIQVTSQLVMYLNNKQYDEFKKAKKFALDLEKISTYYHFINTVYQTEILQNEIL